MGSIDSFREGSLESPLEAKEKVEAEPDPVRSGPIAQVVRAADS
jgi:hypothetical protein